MHMTYTEQREATFEWLEQQSLSDLIGQIQFWLRTHKYALASFYAWCSEYEHPVPDDIRSADTALIEQWLTENEWQIEAFEEWFVDMSMSKYGIDE